MGWTSPFVLTALFGGFALLVIFVYVETKVAEPLFRVSLFRIRAFAAGNVASLMLAMGRGGMQFMLIIWLQGIWLPLHGYDFSQTPLWAGIYLVPLTVGFLAAAPLSGILSDKFGPKPFTVGGALLTGASFLLLIFVPVNFAYWEFAIVIALNGFGSGLFFSPNWAEMMNSVPADRRGAAGGMIATFMNSASVLSIGIFFSLMVSGLASSLPNTMFSGLTAGARSGVGRAKPCFTWVPLTLRGSYRLEGCRDAPTHRREIVRGRVPAGAMRPMAPATAWPSAPVRSGNHECSPRRSAHRNS